MKMMNLAITILCALCLAGTSVLTSEAATTFNGSTIVGVDQARRTITFKTREGETVTLEVADPNVLKEKKVTKGEQVSIEIDLNDRITKVLQHFEPPREYFVP